MNFGKHNLTFPCHFSKLSKTHVRCKSTSCANSKFHLTLSPYFTRVMLQSSILCTFCAHFQWLTQLGLTPFIKKKKYKKERNKRRPPCFHFYFPSSLSPPKFFALHFLPPTLFSSSHHEAVPTPTIP
jgi:hypothetical protein